MSGITAKHIHQRTLLVGATVALAFSGASTWWETDTRVYSGWSQVGSGGSGLMTGWERVILVTGITLMLAIGVAACWPPYRISPPVSRTIGLVIAALGIGMLAMAASGGDSYETHGGLVVSALLALVVAFLWMSLANNPWPQAETAEASATSDPPE
ncbi:hypothetical protein [Kribbella sp. VKM Ac-2569]|uniref:hypothetical protein n=1 Tax=Kribbella sp. VKM Ac-2569 TaxID=2512220 RepID=UPI00102D24D4|nr:hypothetical protein [Kribbella sp. VKM Ac-2569]